MDALTSAHVGSSGRHKSKQQNVQGNQKNTGSQGALAAVLAAVRESSEKQAEGQTRLEEQLKTLETKQEASCEKLAKKIRKEKPYTVEPLITEKALEDVQKFGLRLASHRWDASYNELLDLFDLPSHEDRRLHLKLGLLFKIVQGLCYYPDVPPFRVQPYSYRSNHSYQLVCPTANTNAYHFSFFPHTISNWNALDCGTVSTSKYSSFMRLLS